MDCCMASLEYRIFAIGDCTLIHMGAGCWLYGWVVVLGIVLTQAAQITSLLKNVLFCM